MFDGEGMACIQITLGKLSIVSRGWERAVQTGTNWISPCLTERTRSPGAWRGGEEKRGEGERNVVIASLLGVSGRNFKMCLCHVSVCVCVCACVVWRDLIYVSAYFGFISVPGGGGSWVSLSLCRVYVLVLLGAQLSLLGQDGEKPV